MGAPFKRWRHRLHVPGPFVHDPEIQLTHFMPIQNDIPDVMPIPRFVGDAKIEFGSKPVPKPGPGQLLLRVKANALCGSERPQFYAGSVIIPGHEAAGIVVAAGAHTTTSIGTPGVVFLMDFCSNCRSCKLGLTNQCLAKRADMGFTHDGGYGPYELVHENIFFPVDPDINLVEATMLLDIMGTSAHAIGRARMVRTDIESVFVTGAGPIGLGILAMAKILLGPEVPVIVADTIPYRLKLVEKMGGRPINIKDATVSQGLKNHGFDHTDLAVDTAGKSVARQACMETLGQRGVLVCVGHGEGLQLTISPQIIAPERSILGSEYFCFDELADNLELLHQHRNYLKTIITHRFGVSDIQHAFELFFQGDTGKVIIEQ
jgi:threonine 3-dehydrogenase